MAKNKSASRNSVSSRGNIPKNNTKRRQRIDKRKEACVEFTNELCENVSFSNNINSKANYDDDKQSTDFKVAKMKNVGVGNCTLNNKIKEVISGDKKVFNKRKWRSQTYSRKYKVEQWEERRKKVVLREFYKEIKHEKPGIDVAKIYAEDGSLASGRSTISTYSEEDNNTNLRSQGDSARRREDDRMTKKKKPFKKAHLEFQKIRREKQQSQEEEARKRKERVKARKLREEERFGKRKKLTKKTKMGQPVMKGRLELLLEQIQRQT